MQRNRSVTSRQHVLALSPATTRRPSLNSAAQDAEPRPGRYWSSLRSSAATPASVFVASVVRLAGRRCEWASLSLDQAQSELALLPVTAVYSTSRRYMVRELLSPSVGSSIDAHLRSQHKLPHGASRPIPHLYCLAMPLRQPQPSNTRGLLDESAVADRRPPPRLFREESR